MDVLKLIEGKYHSFSKGQKKIADFVLNNFDKAAYMTANKLGATVGTSESTVVRFSSELGFSGYPEFQDKLQMAIRNKLTALQRMEAAAPLLKKDNLLKDVMHADLENIRRSMEEIDICAFNTCVDAILAAKSITVIGLRTSTALAGFLGLYLNMIFENVKTITSTSINEIFENIMRIGKNDVVIVISYPRYSKRTVQAAEYASKQGACVIAVTDCEYSPIIKYASHSLLARSEMSYFVDSFAAPLSLINALIVAVGLRKKDELEASFERLEHLWEEYHVYEKY